MAIERIGDLLRVKPHCRSDRHYRDGAFEVFGASAGAGAETLGAAALVLDASVVAVKPLLFASLPDMISVTAVPPSVIWMVTLPSTPFNSGAGTVS